VYLRLDISNFVRVWKITTQRKFWFWCVINSKNNNLSQSHLMRWIVLHWYWLWKEWNFILNWSLHHRERERSTEWFPILGIV
jgi:hypothetical protein